MTFTKEQFILFCYMYEQENGFDVELDRIELEETETGYSYAATFRDEYNYKIAVTLSLDAGQISWSDPDFYGDEEEDTKPFFYSHTREIYDNFVSKINEEK